MQKAQIGPIVTALLALPVTAVAAAVSGPPAAAAAGLARDYQMVRSVGLALAAIGFLMGLAKATTTEIPHERSRAHDLLVKAGVIFLMLTADRMIARGVTGWLGFSTASLPLFWQ